MTQQTTPPYRKKLIEVALPLEAINKESAREKSIRHGHPSTLHLWWARRPLAACRAVIFSSLVDDPSAWPELFPTEEEQEKERERIFRIIEELVIWENSNNPGVLLKAHTEIARSLARGRNEPLPEGADAIRAYIAEHAPPLYDPFCGGGSIPLEAQRLGLKAYASDLNPVAVLITKALIEIPPKFAGMPPVNPESRKNKKISGGWEGAKGLAEDVRYYGQWMRDEAEKRIGHLYPKVKITEEMAKDRPDLEQYVGQDLTVIAWLWARTVKCPNPGCGARTPLVRTLWVSKKSGKEVYLEPVIDFENKKIKWFDIKKDGVPHIHTTDAKGASCIYCNTFIKKPQLRDIAIESGIETIPLAIVAEGKRSRIYLPSNLIENVKIEKPSLNFLDQPMTNDRRWFSPPLYGLPNFSDLFTSRQLVALTTFSDLIEEVRNQVMSHAKQMGNDHRTLEEGGEGPIAYADAIATYLSFPIGRGADYWSSLATWYPGNQQIGHTFTRQALPMVWDFAEANPLSNSSGSWISLWSTTLDAFNGIPSANFGEAHQSDARSVSNQKFIVSTDPPYYDNIGYSDLSDYFYIWLRRSLHNIHKTLFSTVLTPKNQELIASQHRHNGNKEKATQFFEVGLGDAFSRIHDSQNSNFPMTVYYAFKQSESGENLTDIRVASTGWETMLNALVRAGFIIIGTWPMRSEQSHRMVAHGTNALASSIVLVCRPRPEDAKTVTRREFLSALKKELPQALHNLQQGLIAPVDLAQAAIGPGMAVFTRYAKVMESDGSAMTVRTALGIINQILDEVLAEQEGEFDTDTRWAVSWFEQHGMEEGPYGEAETLATAKNIAVQGLVDAGILTARGGKVHLINRSEYPDNWDPATDTRLPVWEATQHLIRTLENQGEQGAADLLNKLGGTVGDQARDLAYRLYAICERKKWSSEALAYNSLIISWPEISKLAQGSLPGTTGQQTL